MSVLVFVELAAGEVKGSSLEAISYGHALGLGEVTALVLGIIDESKMTGLGKYGAQSSLLLLFQEAGKTFSVKSGSHPLLALIPVMV